jgi:hypothetical protein
LQVNIVLFDIIVVSQCLAGIDCKLFGAFVYVINTRAIQYILRRQNSSHNVEVYEIEPHVGVLLGEA